MTDLPLKILLVDDNHDDYLIIKSMLGHLTGEPQTWQLDWVDTAPAATILMQQHRHDVYLIDYRLRRASGLTLLELAHQFIDPIPCIMLTAERDLKLERQALNLGATDYLVKGEFQAPLLKRTMLYAVEHARRQNALQQTVAQYARALSGSQDGWWEWNITSGRFTVSERWAAMVGDSAANLTSTVDMWFESIHTDDRLRVRDAIAAHLTGDTPSFACEYRLRCHDGTYRWFYGRGTAEPPAVNPRYFTGMQTDLSAQKGREADLTLAALHDSLTGLPNRRMLDQHLLTLFENPHCSTIEWIVLMLDLDGFKQINDRLGHAAGDRVLIEVARRFQQTVRDHDLVARVGGDEFVILIQSGMPTAAIAALVDRLKAAVRMVLATPDGAIQLGVSIGVIQPKDGFTTPDAILEAADQRMYRSKRNEPDLAIG